MSRWGYYDYFEPSRPREAKGGIKSQSKRGTFGQSWWARRWISVLESFNIGARLGRGRSYARKGQVLSINIDKGKVTATVQGSRARPYKVKIKVEPLSMADWERLAEDLSNQAIFVAKLLAGEMPQDIEKAFESVGLSLFPRKSGDLETDCSCPDWSNPCKHIAAVYYLLGEEFDRDPFLIFKLRGISREELVKLLGHIGGKSTTGKPRRKPTDRKPELETPQQSEPLTSDVSGFWGKCDLPDDFFGEVRIPPVPAALPKRLGNFPFWRGKERLLEGLEPIYAKASPMGIETFLGRQGTED